MIKKYNILLLFCVFEIFSQSSCISLGVINYELESISLDRGLEHLKKKEYNQAIQAFQVKLQINPKDIDTYIWLATAYDDQGDKDAALQTLKKVLELEPNHISANMRLGYVYYKKADYKNALVAFKKTAELDPKNTENLKFLGSTSFYLDDNVSAKEYFLKYESLEENPSANTLGTICANYFNLKEFEQAKIYAEKSIKTDPSVSLAYFILGGYFYQKRDYENAEKNFKLAEINSKGESVNAIYYLGKLYFEKKRFQSAFDYFSKLPSSYRDTEKLKQESEKKLEELASKNYLKTYFENVFSAYDLNVSEPQSSMSCLSDTSGLIEKQELKSVITNYIKSQGTLDLKKIIFVEELNEYKGHKYQPYHYILRAKVLESKNFNETEMALLDAVQKAVLVGIINGVPCKFNNHYDKASSQNRSYDDYFFINFIPTNLLLKYDLSIKKQN